ncbi:MAG: hypothetical protein QOI41_1873, partial [Myxococcales bacterium]|nr:hypothetical protein [Myxococcales bacterium]
SEIPAQTEVDARDLRDLQDTAHDARPIDERHLPAPAPLQIAARYEIGTLLGEGVMGEVRDCRDLVLDRSIAL